MSDDDRRVRDAEVVDGGYRRGGFQGPRVTYFTMMGPGAPGHQGMPFASAVTLALFFFCLFQWGFLACLGFVFFYALASAAGVYHNLRVVMQGRVPNPWLWRCGSWIFSVLMVSWLAR